MNATINLAIADNYPAIRQGLVNLLRTNSKMNVVVDCSDGKQLLTSLELLPILPDIVLLDINMPVMDGYSTAAELRKRFPQIRIVAFSFYTNEYNIIRMINCGAVAYLPKAELSFDEMVTAIETVNSKGYYYSDLVPDTLFEKALQNDIPQFTPNEIQFLRLCCEGLSDKQVADRMCISVRSVEYYFKSVSTKLNISKRIGIVAYVLKAGIIPWQ